MGLDDYLRKQGRGALVGLAKAIGVTPSTMSKLRYGRRDPSLRQAIAIQKASGGQVRVSDFVAACQTR